jgi:hypothetical protein
MQKIKYGTNMMNTMKTRRHFLKTAVGSIGAIAGFGVLGCCKHSTPTAVPDVPVPVEETTEALIQRRWIDESLAPENTSHLVRLRARTVPGSKIHDIGRANWLNKYHEEKICTAFTERLYFRWMRSAVTQILAESDDTFRLLIQVKNGQPIENPTLFSSFYTTHDKNTENICKWFMSETVQRFYYNQGLAILQADVARFDKLMHQFEPNCMGIRCSTITTENWETISASNWCCWHNVEDINFNV